MPSRFLAITLLALPLLAAAQSEYRDTRLQPIADPLRVQFPASEPPRSDEVMRATIRTAAAAKAWRVESDTPGRMELSLVVRDKHTARVEVVYFTSGYMIRYLDSTNLLYDANARAIHANYNAWVKQLAQAINGGLGTSAWAATPAGAVAAAPAASATAASTSRAAEGLPAVGSRWRYGFRDQQYRGPERLFTVEVTGVSGSKIEERLALDNGEISLASVDAEEARFLRRSVQGSSVLELAPYSNGLKGKASVMADSYPGGLNDSWKIGSPAFTEEMLTVPAGTFRTVRVDVKGTAEAFGASTFTMAQTPARFEYTAWYAPELHRYVRSRHQMWNRFSAPIGDEVTQLLAYQPAN
jgi:hypothetical protein